ncbi:hypothetical protein BsWGS_21095 [Bradybaena similaris]
MMQRTFNQMNTSPTIFEQDDLEIMEAEPVQKGKRGRKRQSNEECLTEAERIKKEKNRQAAQKCREKKEREAKDLKIRNEELERENKKLSDEKKKLEDRAKEFHKIIQDHMLKGCKLPPNVQEVYNEGQISMPPGGCSDDVELYRAVGTIERDHTPPLTPEELSSGNPSPHPPNRIHNITRAPTALFSGTPLTEDDITRKRSGSISRSPSLSPAPPMSPSKPAAHLLGQQKDLSYFLANNKVPRALAPISPCRAERDEVKPLWFSSRSQQSVPTVVSEIEDDSEDTTEYIYKCYEIPSREKTMTEPSSEVTETAFQLPDIPSEDEVAKQLARQDQTTQGEEGKPNLPSLGFSCIQGYSYTDDLQQMESVQEIIDYTSDGLPDNNQLVVSRKQNSILPNSENSQAQPVVNVSVFAPALLGMCEEMSESLQQQIKTSYIAPTTSSLGNVSVPDVTQLTPNKNHQNVFTHSGQVVTHANIINKPFNTAVKQLLAVGEGQQLVVSEEQQLAVGEGQQLVVSEEQQLAVGEGQQLDYQKLVNYLEILQGGKQIKNEHDTQHLSVSPEQIQEIIKLLMNRNMTVHIQNVDQSVEVSQVVPNLESHQLPRKVTSLSLPSKSPFVRQSSEKLPDPQQSPDQMSAGTSTARILPGLAGAPVSNNTLTHAQILNPTPAQVVHLSGSSSYSAAGETSDPPVTTQHQFVVKEGTRLILVNQQLSQAASCTAQTPTLIVSPSSSALTSEGTDYSVNVQDLPSLNLTELNSDNNLFEKKPSRSTS